LLSIRRNKDQPIEINQYCQQDIADNNFSDELIKACFFDQVDSGINMEPYSGNPKDDVIKFVPPEPIHTLKLGIFITPCSLEDCISSREVYVLSE
jgi:hypothetical protein